MQYRRVNIPGACYFFTVNLAERNKTLLTDHIDELRAAFATIKQNHPFKIDAIGNISSKMKKILKGMWITFIIIR